MPEIESQQHEPNEIGVRYVVIGLAAIAMLIVAALALNFGWLAIAGRDADSADVQPATPAPENVQTLPRLDPNQAKSLAELRADERRLLTSYEWLDEQQGLARIPIDRAIEIIAEQGLPETGAGQQPSTNPNDVDESN